MNDVAETPPRCPQCRGAHTYEMGARNAIPQPAVADDDADPGDRPTAETGPPTVTGHRRDHTRPGTAACRR
ncbi:hypothetical protein EHYA_08364 [Embleya hyalina]|uniref:Uncharacterized protein n=1 Tax=Embleya hyalina TaxID=516124 RepID=A0A401Z1C3_9ACTN|nr:hypothetical protein EHYA_08364 [Embleya hyalina]